MAPRSGGGNPTITAFALTPWRPGRGTVPQHLVIEGRLLCSVRGTAFAPSVAGHDPTPPRLPRLRPNPPPACRAFDRPLAVVPAVRPALVALSARWPGSPARLRRRCNNPVPNRQHLRAVRDQPRGRPPQRPRYERRGPAHSL